MRAVAALLAHAGGWDEVLFVALPVALFAGLLAVANRRAQAEERRRAEAGEPERDDGTTTDEHLP